ncbi:Protein-L-isoaspartate(D-aspartate) O-methyltransferase [Clydaea vesicula]|uniref:protein-L-isoaspartate(D-aspartate) O-methyltransferase n=1 Tax=Clydaea vesicula TaxID=447962 RepID=A0AAD5TTN8_9FUNG|nr:Protein-L-isoaspartate(D-aspartate) O-methyltransferase [Clydaea vesicula]
MGIGYGATISAPHMHAFCLEAMLDYLKPGNKVLDVGSGSGYLSSCFYQLVKPTGKVFGVEHINELVEFSRKNVLKDHPEFLKESNDEGGIKFLVGDGRKGLKSESPFDAIHVGAAASQFPQDLLDQLNSPGVMIIPVGNSGEDQYLVKYEKDKSAKVTKKNLMGVMYVPLTSKQEQLFER